MHLLLSTAFIIICSLRHSLLRLLGLRRSVHAARTSLAGKAAGADHVGNGEAVLHPARRFLHQKRFQHAELEAGPDADRSRHTLLQLVPPPLGVSEYPGSAVLKVQVEALPSEFHTQAAPCLHSLVPS